MMATTTLSCSASTPAQESPQPNALIKSIALDNVWSGHRVKPYLLTRGKHQFVAYFDANRQMTVAHREGANPWRYYKVDSWLGWDSHNYVTLEVDKEGYIHLIGNMHADPLEYFRSSEPYQVRSLQRVEVMVDKSVEKRMTYPIFLLNKNNDLIVKYRDGGSGNGNEIYNIYDTSTQTWRRLHTNQFLDGQGLMSGYFEGPVLGPDGNFHLIWVWRNTPSADSNHSLSYATSPDLVSWFDSNGNTLELPLTLDKVEIVDPVPPKGGMINGNVKIGFDQQQRPVISYHKYDEDGDTEIFVARKEGKGWKTSQLSEWDGFRWEFGGHGSLGRFPVRPSAPVVLDDKNLGVTVRKDDSILQFVVDSETLATVRVENTSLYPAEIDAVSRKSNQKMLQDTAYPFELHVQAGSGQASSGNQFYLSWFSQPGNRDRAHTSISLPGVLLVHEFAQQ
ncbi:BNR repeat-containing protein [Alteromonas aestuariivivens]|nr:BNR repeat-containing protein [Alteromonas aestuariivivens]